jgi:hypothetical protein
VLIRKIHVYLFLDKLFSREQSEGGRELGLSSAIIIATFRFALPALKLE